MAPLSSAATGTSRPDSIPRVFAVEQPRASDRRPKEFIEAIDTRYVPISDDADATTLAGSLRRLSPGAIRAVRLFHRDTDDQEVVRRNHAHLARTQVSLSREIVESANDIILYLNRYFGIIAEPFRRNLTWMSLSRDIRMFEDVIDAFSDDGRLNNQPRNNLQLAFYPRMVIGELVGDDEQLSAMASSVAAAIEHANPNVIVQATVSAEAHGAYVVPAFTFRFIDAVRPGTLER